MDKQEMTSSESACRELEKSILSALATYSNVHRGSGQYSKVTTHLYEKARCIVLESLGLPKSKYMVVFCSGRRANGILSQLPKGSCKLITSKDLGLSLGVYGVIIPKGLQKKIKQIDSGGGNTSLYGSDWVIWAGMPGRLEAGTPAIVNVIAFAKALKLSKQYERNVIQNPNHLSARAILALKETLAGKDLLRIMQESFSDSNVKVPTTKGLATFVNLDSSASTPALKPAIETFIQTLHQPAGIQKELIQKVRQICADFVNASEGKFDILFTNNATESINIIAQSESNASRGEIEPVILTSILEHSSNDLPWRNVSRATVERLGVDKGGFFDLEELGSLLRNYNVDHAFGNKRIVLVALSGASNVLGTCNDLTAIGKIVKKYDARMLVDAAQLIAHQGIDMHAINADFLAFSGHKMYAPFGTGVLVARKGMLHLNKTQLDIIKDSGEENAAGIAALGKAMLILKRIGFQAIQEEEKSLLAKVSQALKSLPEINIYGNSNVHSLGFEKKTSVLAFDFKNRMASSISKKLAFRGGIGIRYGCHCAHLLVKNMLNFTPAQEKIQKFVLSLLPFITLQGVLRVSFGLHNTDQDADKLIAVLNQIVLSSKQGEESDLPRDRNLFTEKQVSLQVNEFIAIRELAVYGN